MSRGYGKSAISRRGAEDLAAIGMHIHVAARDGLWCLSWQPVGYLYALIRAGG